MTKAHRLATRKKEVSPLPLNFLLGCSAGALGEFELARLNEVANLRSEMLAILDRMIDQAMRAALAAWFRNTDVNVLKAALENPEDVMEWARSRIRNSQRSEEELIPLPSLPPGAAHLAAAIRYAERNMAEGKCRICPKPLAHHSVQYCDEHLAKVRHRAQQKKGLSLPGGREYLYSGEISESTHGRTPNTLAALALNRERKTRTLLNDLGIKPEHAAVSLNAAVEALLRNMPRFKADALTQTTLFEKAGVVTKTTGQRALAKLLSTGEIQRIGKGVNGNPFRYFAA
jgi:hypothetical protein